MKIVFVASIIRNSLCIIYVFYFFFQKSLTENYFMIAAINLATRGPLYTCLVISSIHLGMGKMRSFEAYFVLSVNYSSASLNCSIRMFLKLYFET